MNKPQQPLTLTAALELANHTLTLAHELQLETLHAAEFLAEEDLTPHLTELGRITAAGSELDGFTEAAEALRQVCKRRKPTAETYSAARSLLLVLDPLSSITAEVLHRLPALAAAVAQDRAAYTFTEGSQPRHLTDDEQAARVTAAREQAATACTILESLPGTLARIKALAEAGESLKPAADWLK